MPCSDNRPGDREYDRQLQLFWKAYGQPMCEWMRNLEGSEREMRKLPQAEQDWWEAHKKWDEVREESYE